MSGGRGWEDSPGTHREPLHGHHVQKWFLTPLETLPGSRHKGDIPKSTGSVRTRCRGHRPQHWQGARSTLPTRGLVGSGGAVAAAVSRGQHSAWRRAAVQPTQWKTARSPGQRACCESTVGARSRGRSTVQPAPLATAQAAEGLLPAGALAPGREWAGPRVGGAKGPLGASTYSALNAAPWGLWWAL